MTRLLLAVSALVFQISVSAAQAATFKVDCDKGQSIQQRLNNNVQDGDTVEVSGDCHEGIEIAQNRVRLICEDNASISGVAGAGNTIAIRASDVTVADCDVKGGDAQRGAFVILVGASATLTNNIVSGANGNGISVTQSSYARITGGEVSGSGSSGISVSNSSMADIGFVHIYDNGSNGISVLRSAAADLVGNMIVNNSGSGVLVIRTSTATFSTDVTLGNALNLIEGNDSRGIGCFDNSAVQFGEAQNYGTGNGTPNGHGFGKDWLFEGTGFCAVSGTP